LESLPALAIVECFDYYPEAEACLAKTDVNAELVATSSGGRGAPGVARSAIGSLTDKVELELVGDGSGLGGRRGSATVAHDSSAHSSGTIARSTAMSTCCLTRVRAIASLSI